jgi:hypothetical protein
MRAALEQVGQVAALVAPARGRDGAEPSTVAPAADGDRPV